ncbi:hypothetical protein OA88_19245 [Flavobacterium sp. JRM]|nr:hypothetical protein OA88_19245 [Flavobacterium sp. JRM]
MISVITGDIIGSRQLKSKDWIENLKKLFSQFGKNPSEWEIYRGDEFQIEIKNPEEALLATLLIKAYLRSIKLDARMSIGFGDKTYTAKKISESNGTAFINSGELFETLKKQKTTLALKSGNLDFDTKLNLMLRLSLTFMDNWLVPAAKFIVIAIQNPTLSQEGIGIKLGINQAAVSRRQKRAQYDLMIDLDQYFRSQIKEFTL